MRCRKTEKLLSRSLDDRLTQREKRTLESHLESCPRCRARAERYRSMIAGLREESFPTPPPYYWERLRPRLQTRPAPGWLPIGKQIGLKAIPIALLVLFILASAALFFLPAQPDEISRSAALLRDENPLEDSFPVLTADGVDNPGIALIFTAADSGSTTR